MKRLGATFRLWRFGQEHQFAAVGQTARALLVLIEAGERGVTALECGGWAFRLAAYCHELRHRYGLDIETRRESHPGGWHGRHVLRTPVEVVEVAEPEDEPCWAA